VVAEGVGGRGGHGGPVEQGGGGGVHCEGTGWLGMIRGANRPNWPPLTVYIVLYAAAQQQSATNWRLIGVQLSIGAGNYG